MKFSYYPGCSAHSTGRELDESLHNVCKHLGITLEELDDWTCCGASSAHGADPYLAVALPARNLALAKDDVSAVATTCSACYLRLRQALKHVREDGSPEGVGEIRSDLDVVNMLDVFLSDEMIGQVAQKAHDALKGLKLVCYYGCLSVRPPDVTGVDNPENPVRMDRLMEAAGAEVIDWPYKTMCCGGSLTMTNIGSVHRLAGEILDMAHRSGADAVVTGCPMCFMNLDRSAFEIQKESGKSFLPVFYFTELLSLAFDGNFAKSLWKRHLNSPVRVLESRGL